MFYNTHIHTFREDDVPRKFLPLGLVRILASRPGYFVTAKLLNNFNPFSDNDMLDRYVKFVNIGKLGSQQKIFEECLRFYPDDTQFFILAMDMAHMEAGKVPRDYKDQLKELGELKVTYPQVHPFMHVDPRHEGHLDLLKQCIEEWDFTGVKLYPPLGYFPFDPRMYPVYEYCQANNLPIVAHCSPYNPVHNKGSKRKIKKLLEISERPIKTRGKSKKELCSNFTNPLNYKKVLTDFPNLKICLAHFGSTHYWEEYLSNPGREGNWFEIIKDMIEEYPSLYSDISFTLNRKEFFPVLKVLLTDDKLNKQILFGSDYYMVETKSDERRFGIDLRAAIGESDFKQIAVTNPKEFLGI